MNLQGAFHCSFLVSSGSNSVADQTHSADTVCLTLSGRGMQPFISAHLLITLRAPTGPVEAPRWPSRGPQRSPHSGSLPAAGLWSQHRVSGKDRQQPFHTHHVKIVMGGGSPEKPAAPQGKNKARYNLNLRLKTMSTKKNIYIYCL